MHYEQDFSIMGYLSSFLNKKAKGEGEQASRRVGNVFVFLHYGTVCMLVGVFVCVYIYMCVCRHVSVIAACYHLASSSDRRMHNNL